jgi:hypothetical protein
MVKLVQLRRPFVVGIVVEGTASSAERAAASAFAEGADAVELNVSPLRDQTGPARDFFARLGGPIYTSFRRAGFLGLYGPRFGKLPFVPDDERMARQLALVATGAAGLDLEADTFAPHPDEWTRDRKAIRRQGEVIDAVHRRRAAAIISWHPPHKLAFSEALRAARTLRDRGADFVKIVERVRSRAEALDSVAISLRLADEVDFPFIFLPLGPAAARFRPFMTAFGSAYLLARPSVGSNRLAAQPTVASARILADLTSQRPSR